jgi:hypothetical protein
MPHHDEYLKHADKLAQDVVSSWGQFTKPGGATALTSEFKSLVDKAVLYQNARRLADNHREHNLLSQQDEAEEKATREAFAEAYKAVYEKHAAAS